MATQRTIGALHQVPPLVERPAGWFTASERSAKWIKASFLLIGVIYLGFLGIAECGPVNLFGNDVLLLLDGGWRIFHGQVPSRDFYSGLGPLEYSLTAFGMLLTHGGPGAIALGNVSFGAVIGIWSWLLLRRRMPLFPALAAVAWLVLTATAPSPLFGSFLALSPAMIYNRHGWALLAIVLAECALSSQRGRFLGGVSSGIALMLLAFLKLNFFGVAFLLLMTTIPMKREEMRRGWGILAGIAGTTAVFLVYIRFAISAFLGDMLLVTHARGEAISYLGMIVEFAHSTVLISVAIFSVVAAVLVTGGKLRQRYGIRLILIGFLVVATAPLLRQTNSLEIDYQLTAFWVIVLMGCLAAAYPRAQEKTAILSVIALGVGLVAFDFTLELVSVANLARYQFPSIRSNGAILAGPQMENLRFYDTGGPSGDNGPTYVADVNDGVALLTRNSSPEETVFTLGFHNPFSYLLRRKPAMGGSTYLLVDNNFSRVHPLEASRVFGDAALIMVPHYLSSHQDSDEKIEQIYHAYLLEHFSYVASSRAWTLYRRRE